MRLRPLRLVIIAALVFPSLSLGFAQVSAQNVVVITMDGFRWQEMFTGPGSEYFKKDKNGRPGDVEKRYWRETPEERPAFLLPFIWGEVARNGQIFGDPSKGSRAHVTNGLWFSAADMPPSWDYGTFDAPMVYAAIEALRTSRPRVLYIMLGDGDEWAHQGRYELYLDAAQRADRFIKRVWDTLQSLPDYAGRTTLLLTTDHGRGDTIKEWSDHGRKVPAAETTWMAALGPGVPALGVREGVTVTTSQLAATIAAAVGEDFNAASPRAAAPLPGIVRK